MKAVTIGKTPPPVLTAHYTGVGWMLTMEKSGQKSMIKMGGYKKVGNKRGVQNVFQKDWGNVVKQIGKQAG